MLNHAILKLVGLSIVRKRSKSNNFFCNRSCLAIWKNGHVLLGESNGNWKGGENAYRGIMLRNKIRPICTECGITNLKVLVVHHIDQNSKNNMISNLKWLCRNCHYLEHKGKTF
jgi:5-methylcytosine-specific restriction endonuclease McrA